MNSFKLPKWWVQSQTRTSLPEEGDLEGCFEHISSFMNSQRLLELEDNGMVDLLMLKDTVDNVVKCQDGVVFDITVNDDANVHDTVTNDQPTDTTHAPTNSARSTHFSDTDNTTAVNTNQTVPVVENTSGAMASSVGPTPNSELQKMLQSNEELSKKLMQCITTPTTQSVSSQPSVTQSAAQNRETLYSSDQYKPSTLQPREKVISIRELSYLQRREFKIQGGQIGDHNSDITYSNVCKQIDEGIQEDFSDSEIVRAVLRIIKPGNFKDMLMNKDDVTVAELKGFLQSHLREKNSTELFQELMCTKQNNNETPQQFLYRAIGQRIVFTSNLPDASIKYSRATVQDVFLHTVYQGLEHRHNDIRRELKPLLSDAEVKDKTILRHVMKITTEESERQQRLGPTPHQTQTNVRSAQFGASTTQEQGAKQQITEHAAGMDIIQQLSAKIEALTRVVDSMKQPIQPLKTEQTCQFSTRNMTNPRRERTNGCPRCVEQGLSNCNHCFYCGEEGHRAVGCLKKPKHQGNWSRSLQGAPSDRVSNVPAKWCQWKPDSHKKHH
ncbi:uncharacterized protein LOC116395901 [Anarrhichthys ocellatus]|uniref:uncharacterized protein LOC116395901 n=1 Tax=Anarrhichthys ocellatus TaxID=433405 RepID=UPI0012EE14CF|nr:uncharacterized protein LOC116395901 [Anarrhichthys ocellatus]